MPKPFDATLKDQPDPQEITLQHGRKVSTVEVHVVATYQSLTGTNVAVTELELFSKKR